MSRKILLADDSVTIQKVIELTFMDENYEVVSVSNGDAALERLTQLRPDVVIADVHMPGASGYDVCRKAKEIYPGVPVLLLVGTFEPFEEEEAEAAGADSFLKKPFDSQELMRLVESLLPREAPQPAPEPPPVSEPLAAEPAAPDLKAEPPAPEPPVARPFFAAPESAAFPEPAGAPEPLAPVGESEFGGWDAVELATGEGEDDVLEIEIVDSGWDSAEDIFPAAAPSVAASEIEPEPAGLDTSFAEIPPAELEPVFELPSPEEPAPTEPEPVFELSRPEPAPTEPEPVFELSPPEPAPTEPEPVFEFPSREEPPPEPVFELSPPEPSPEPEPEAPVFAPEPPTSVEPVAAAPAPSTSPLSDDDVERIALRVVELIGESTLRDIAWEIIPDLAEIVIRDRLQELESQVEGRPNP